MKNLILLSICILFVNIIHAQSPNKFNYQAVARGQSGTVITGNIDIRLSFLEDGPGGNNLYTEQHTVATNTQGVFNLTINEGSQVSGNKNLIDWKNHQYWLKVEIKTPGEASFTEMGKTQLLSVPYAMYAASSGEDLTAGNGISMANGVITNTGDLSDANEIQTLSVNGNQLTISDGNAVTLPTGTTYDEGSGININGNVISADDTSPSNELQQLSISGNQLILSNGNSVTLPSNTYTAGTGIQINNNTINATDASTTNEIQVLSLNGQQLNLSNGGGSVVLPGAGTSSWSLVNTNITSSPATNNVVIGSNNNFGSKLYVAGSGAQHAGNFYSPGSGNALNAYCNNAGAGISSGSLTGPGGSFNSVSGPALVTGSGNVGIGISNPTHLFEVNGPIFTKSINAHSPSGFAGTFYNSTGPALLIDQSSVWNGIQYNYDGDHWQTAIDGQEDFVFGFNDHYTAWILSTDGSYHTSSDRALKKDIEPFSNVLGRLNQLQAYTYHMKNAPDDSPISVGFMAQEVEEQFPQLVLQKDGFRSICYDQFAVLSVEAIKEQQIEIEDLKTQITELKELVTALMKK